MVHKGAIKLQYVSIDEQVVDALTKPLSRVKPEYFRDKVGVVQKDLPWKGEQWWWCCSGIVSSLDISPKVIHRPLSPCCERIASSLELCPKVIGTDHPVIEFVDFCLQESCRIASSLGFCPKVIWTDHPVIESVYFCLQENGSIALSLDLCPKVIGPIIP